MRLVRVPSARAAVLACALAGVCACGADAPGADPPRSQPTVGAGSTPVLSRSPTGLPDALGVLRSWDARRAVAWRAQDPAALRALYVPGSSALAADLALLRAYAERRLVVRRLETQVFAADLLHRSPRVLRLRVHDRVVSASVRSRSGSETVRASEPERRVVELRRVGGRWTMALVAES